MATLHQFRLVVIVPVGKMAAFAAWYQANIDPDDYCSRWAGLNLTGDASAATHQWASMALKDAELKAILLKAAQIGGVTPPTNAQWTSWDLAAKAAWVNSVRAALFTTAGIYLDLCDNAGGVFTDPDSIIQVVALRRRQG